MTEHVRHTITPLQRLLLEHMEATGEGMADIARRGDMPRQTVQAVLYRAGTSVPLEATMVKLAKGLALPVDTVRQAAAEGLAGAGASGAAPTAPVDPLLGVLMDEASSLTPSQRQVLVDLAKSLRRQQPAQTARRRPQG